MSDLVKTLLDTIKKLEAVEQDLQNTRGRLEVAKKELRESRELDRILFAVAFPEVMAELRSIVSTEESKDGSSFQNWKIRGAKKFLALPQAVGRIFIWTYVDPDEGRGGYDSRGAEYILVDDKN